MKFTSVQVVLSFCLTSLIIGVAPMVAMTKSLPESDWVEIKNAKELVQISFPRKPLESKFVTPFKQHSEKGKLHVYSVPLEKDQGLLVMSVLSGTAIGPEFLEKKQFKDNFYNYFVKYVFNEPQLFKHSHEYLSNLHEFEGEEYILSFEFSYNDKQGKQLLKGVAMVHHHHLYQLFYLANAKNYQEEILKKFVESFTLLD